MDKVVMVFKVRPSLPPPRKDENEGPPLAEKASAPSFLSTFSSSMLTLSLLTGSLRLGVQLVRRTTASLNFREDGFLPIRPRFLEFAEN
jgi:hypothetical protein